MPEEVASPSTPFDEAASTVEEWLDGPGAGFAARTRQPNATRRGRSWDVAVEHGQLGTRPVRFSLPRDFPASPARVHVDKDLCLVLPHVEEDGKVCLGVEASPDQYNNPLSAAGKVLADFDRFLERCADPAWISAEFHRERLSYWSRFCGMSASASGRAAPNAVRVVLSPFERAQEGQVVSYSKQGASARSDLLLSTVGDIDPHVLASRHGWASGTVVRGHALFVQLPESARWTPADWPRGLGELESLVAQVTDHECSVVHWLHKKQDGDAHPFLVVLVQGTVPFGYLVTPAVVPRLTSPGVLPVPVERADVEWALTRDQGLDSLHERRQKRVLILGCGSVGSPIAELLARAGVGELHLVDKESFELENCSRHVLGMKDVSTSKALSLAKRLREQIPGVDVKGHVALASSWIANVCKPGRFDLVIDCTGESSVRTVLAQYRALSLGPCNVAHVWMEPFGAAAHVVFLKEGDNWPSDDPADTQVNVARWPSGTRVLLPACASGFHPYGAADAWQAAGFASERLLAGLDGTVSGSTIWTNVRSKAFFDSLGVAVQTGPLVPEGLSHFDTVAITRTYAKVFSSA